MVDTSPAPEYEDQAGDTQQNALSLGLLEPGSTLSYSEYLGGADTSDYLSFEITAPYEVNITASGFSSDIDLFIEDQAGVTIGSSEAPSTQNEALLLTLSPGLYYINLSVFEGYGPYDLILFARPALRDQTSRNILDPRPLL